MSLEQIQEALAHAKAKHPDPWRGKLHALCVLFEEVAEVVWALIRGDRANLREELAQVAAVCWRWLDMLQDGPGSRGRPREGEGVPRVEVVEPGGACRMDEEVEGRGWVESLGSSARRPTCEVDFHSCKMKTGV